MKNNKKCAFCNNDIKRYQTKTDTYFCDNKCKSDWQVKQREDLGFTKEWLIDEYFNKGKDCNLIAKEIGRNGKRVWEWFKQYGINVNKRGTNWESKLIQDGSTFLGRKHTQETRDKIRAKCIEDGRVPYLKNGVHYLKGVTGKDHHSFKGGLTPERQSFYSSIEWVNVVKEVWKRDNAFCQRCNKHHNTDKNRGNFHIHHIISFQIKEHRADINNLVLLCKECHKWVHSKLNTNKQFIKTL